MTQLTDDELADARRYNEHVAGQEWERQQLPWPFRAHDPPDKTFAYLIATFQIENDLPVDGMLGPNTWSKLQTAIEHGRYSVDADSNQKMSEPLDEDSPDHGSPELPKADLGEHDGARRHNGWARTYQLTSSDAPTRDSDWSSERKSEALVDIVEWLDVENAERYGPTENKTYCNIYAYDFCCLAGAYLPRVWWTEESLEKWREGHEVEPHLTYEENPSKPSTVRELNANCLFSWFDYHGADHGWEKVEDVAAVQKAANDGKVAIIVAKRHDLTRSGHITAVVPEKQQEAERDDDGSLLVPLQSQAGRNNHQYHTRKWWTASRFQESEFWVHS